MKSKSDSKLELPSQVRKKAHTKARKELIEYIVENEGLSIGNAIAVIDNEIKDLRELYKNDLFNLRNMPILIK